MLIAFACCRRACPLAGAFLAIVAMGCASGPPKSGFLTDYSGFEKIHDDAPVWRFVDPDGAGRSNRSLRLWADRANLDELGKYDRFIYDPIVVRLDKDSAGNWVSPDKLKELTDEMEKAFVDALSTYYPRVDEPGEGVLRFRTAITDIAPMSVYESPARIAALTWTNSSPGGSSFEAEAVDSITEERIFALIGTGSGGSFDPLSDMDRWDNVRLTASRLGEFIGRRMEEAHESGKSN